MFPGGKKALFSFRISYSYVPRNAEWGMTDHEPEIEKIMGEGTLALQFQALSAHSSTIVKGFSIFRAGWLGGGAFYVTGSRTLTKKKEIRYLTLIVPNYIQSVITVTLVASKVFTHNCATG
jgi:hypothetical protein